MTGNKSRNISRNKHQSLSLSLATLARFAGRLRTSLYQPFAAPSTKPTDASGAGNAATADLSPTARPTAPRRTPRPLAKIILFPAASRPSTTGRRVVAATDNLLVYTDAWYSRAVAKSMPHRPFPGTYV